MNSTQNQKSSAARDPNNKTLYRSQEGRLGGVCEGCAAYFDVDPLVVRIIVVMFTLLSCGLLVPAYAAFCAVVPKDPRNIGPVDVEPRDVSSELYTNRQDSIL